MGLIFILLGIAIAVWILLPKRQTAETSDFDDEEAKYRRIDAARQRLEKFPQQVVGESHYQDVLESICGKRTPNGHECETTATLHLEDDNKFDNKAVAVMVQNNIVGYLPRADAKCYRQMLAADPSTPVNVPAVICGGWKRGRDRGFFGIFLDLTLVAPLPKRARKRAKAAS